MNPVALLGGAAAVELRDICQRRGLDPEVLRALVGAVQGQAGRLRRRGLYDQFDTLLIPPEETPDRVP